MKTLSPAQMLEQCIQDFDWDHVHNYFVQKDWRWHAWHGVSAEPFVPSVEQMKEMIRALFDSAFKHGGSCKSGGFLVAVRGLDRVTLEFHPLEFKDCTVYSDETTD